MNFVLLSCGPFLTLVLAAVLRIVGAVQPETAWSSARQTVLTQISYVLLAVSLAGMLFLVFAVGPIGLIGFVMTAIMTASLIEAEIRIAGVRNRARQVEFLWMLAMAVKSGRPLANEIEAYAQGVSGRRHRKLMDMSDRLRSGVPLTEIIIPQGLLPRSSLMQLHVGISSKSLEESLHSTALRVTNQVADSQSMGQQGSSFLYPAAIVPVALGIVAFLMYYIIPKMKKIFDDFGTELPRITILLISLSDFAVNFWFIVLLPFFYVPFAVFVYISLAEYHGWQAMSQSTFGRWFVRWHSPDILRALSHAVAQGMPIDKALASLSRYTGPYRIRERLAWAAEEIREGSPDWQSLYRSGIIKSNEAILLETAQRTGNLPWVLETLATNLEQRWSFRMNAFLELVHPVMIVVISVGVGFVVLGIFMPLVKLLNDLS